MGKVVGCVKRGNACWVIVNCGGEQLPLYVARRAREDETEPLPRILTSEFEQSDPVAFTESFQDQGCASVFPSLLGAMDDTLRTETVRKEE